MTRTRSERILELAQRQRLLSAADVRAQAWSPQLLAKLEHGGNATWQARQLRWA